MSLEAKYSSSRNYSKNIGNLKACFKKIKHKLENTLGYTFELSRFNNSLNFILIQSKGNISSPKIRNKKL